MNSLTFTRFDNPYVNADKPAQRKQRAPPPAKKAKEGASQRLPAEEEKSSYLLVPQPYQERLSTIFNTGVAKRYYTRANSKPEAYLKLRGPLFINPTPDKSGLIEESVLVAARTRVKAQKKAERLEEQERVGDKPERIEVPLNRPEPVPRPPPKDREVVVGPPPNPRPVRELPLSVPADPAGNAEDNIRKKPLPTVPAQPAYPRVTGIAPVPTIDATNQDKVSFTDLKSVPTDALAKVAPTLARKKRPTDAPEVNMDLVPVAKVIAPRAPRTKPVERISTASVLQLADITETIGSYALYYDETTLKGFNFSDLKNMRERNAPVGVHPLPEETGRGWTKHEHPNASPKPDEITTQLAAAGVLTYKGLNQIKMPGLGLLPEELEQYKDTETPGGQITADRWPALNTNPRTWEPPLYRPYYSAGGYSVPLYDTIVSILGNPAASRDLMAQVTGLYSEFADLTEQYYYGNGSLAGQIGRYNAVKAVTMEVRAAAQVPGAIVKHEAVLDDIDLLDRRFPLSRIPTKLVGLPTAILEATQGSGIEMFRVVPTSGAGIVWGDLKRGQVVWQDLQLADILYTNLETQPDPQKLLEKWNWARLTKMKPKAEVYKVAEYRTKTRNIFECNSFSQIMAQMILKPTHADTKSFVDDDEVWSMIGWSMYSGGMDKLVKRVQAKPLTFCAAYSDNIYLTGMVGEDPSFISMDGEKMEATITKGDVYVEAVRSLMQFEDADDGWLRYVHTLLPMLDVDTVGVIGNQEIPVLGMSSGVQGTGYFNTCKSIRYLDTVMRHKTAETQINVEDRVFSRAASEIGVKFKVEHHVPLTEFDNTAFRVVVMDVLGHDAAPLHDFGVPMWAPVLNRERLLKAMLYPKQQDTKWSIGKKNAFELVRLRALYLAGGWAYPGVDTVLRVRCEQILRTRRLAMEALTQDLELSVVEELVGAKNAEIVHQLMNSLAKPALPSVYEVISITCGRDAGDTFLEWLRNDPERSKQAYNYAPIDKVPWAPPPAGVVIGQTIGDFQDNVFVPLETYIAGFKGVRAPAALYPLEMRNWAIADENSGVVMRPGRAPKATRDVSTNPSVGTFLTTERWAALSSEAKAKQQQYAQEWLLKTNVKEVRVWENNMGAVSDEDLFAIGVRRLAGLMHVQSPAVIAAAKVLEISFLKGSKNNSSFGLMASRARSLPRYSESAVTT